VRSSGIVVAAVCSLFASAAPAHANDDSLYDRLWPDAPVSGRLTLSQQITDQLTELGNTVGQHMSALSHDTLTLTFDGRRRRAKIRLGLADDGTRFLVLRLDGDVHFTQGVARVAATLDVGIAGHVVQLELPAIDLAPASSRGERGVETRLPLFKRTF